MRKFQFNKERVLYYHSNPCTPASLSYKGHRRRSTSLLQMRWFTLNTMHLNKLQFNTFVDIFSPAQDWFQKPAGAPL